VNECKKTLALLLNWGRNIFDCCENVFILELPIIFVHKKGNGISRRSIWLRVVHCILPSSERWPRCRYFYTRSSSWCLLGFAMIRYGTVLSYPEPDGHGSLRRPLVDRNFSSLTSCSDSWRSHRQWRSTSGVRAKRVKFFVNVVGVVFSYWGCLARPNQILFL